MDLLTSIVAMQQVSFRQDLGAAITKQAVKGESDAVTKLVDTVLQSQGSVDITV